MFLIYIYYIQNIVNNLLYMHIYNFTKYNINISSYNMYLLILYASFYNFIFCLYLHIMKYINNQEYTIININNNIVIKQNHVKLLIYIYSLINFLICLYFAYIIKHNRISSYNSNNILYIYEYNIITNIYMAIYYLF